VCKAHIAHLSMLCQCRNRNRPESPSASLRPVVATIIGCQWPWR